MSTVYPVNGTGLWHDGIHIEGSSPVKLVFPGEVAAYRKKNETIIPDKTPDTVQPEDVLLFSAELAGRMTKGLFGVLQTVGDLTIPLQNELFEKLGLCISGDFFLLKHHIATAAEKGFATKDFSFFSLYMHLTGIPSDIAGKTGSSIKYVKKTAPEYLFPGTVLGNPGRAESKAHLFQLEYFTKVPFKTDSYLTDGNRYTVIPAGRQLFAVTEPKGDETTLPVGTWLEITETPDAVRRPESMQIKIKKIPGTIDIKTAKSRLLQSADTEEKKKKAAELKADDFYSGDKYIIPKGLTAIPVEIAYNGGMIQTDIFTVEAEARGTERQNLYIKKDAVNFGTAWVKTDNTIFMEMKKKNIIRVKAARMFKAYSVPFEEVTVTELKEKTTEEQIVRKDEASVYYGKRDSYGMIYLLYETGKYYRVPDEFENNYWDWKKYFTLCSADDLKKYDDCDTDTEKRDFLQKLYATKGFSPEPCGKNETLEEFLSRTEMDAKKCAFVHASEWSKAKTLSEYIFHYVEQYRSLRDQTSIWDKKGKNNKLPKDIQNGNSLTYFYPTVFEEYIRKLYEGYAADLRLVQDMVMKLWILKQGNLGIYPEIYDDDGNTDNDTFCNHAVFLTIRAVDGNFRNFTGRKDSGFPDPSSVKQYKATYSNRVSNHWCHVLKKQADDSAQTGIMELTGEQAQAYANIGYVVIASWENTVAGGHPHFVTVRPTDSSYTNNESIVVAHVGGKENKEKSLLAAFGSQHVKDVKFYYNFNQTFKCNTDEIKKMANRSGDDK